ncbi:MAG: hypothetical protein JSV96_05765, partial [Candidatus Aminicenantes bacterium]
MTKKKEGFDESSPYRKGDSPLFPLMNLASTKKARHCEEWKRFLALLGTGCAISCKCRDHQATLVIEDCHAALATEDCRGA